MTDRWIEATTLGNLLDRRAHEYPSHDAVVFPDERITYAEYAARSDAIAKGLLAVGVQPGDRVGYFLHDCVDALVVLFGIVKAGATVVPINARFKSFELNTVIGGSGMKVLFTTDPPEGAADFPALVRETLPDLAGQSGADVHVAEAPELRTVVALGDAPVDGMLSGNDFLAGGTAIPDEQLHARGQCVKVRDTAVIMYTSGTTAAPKGAMLSHEAFCRFAAGTANDRMSLTDDDRIWTVLPLFHIGGVGFAVASLYAGAAYCHTGFFRPDVAVGQLANERCTVALAGFETIWLPIVNHPDFADADLSRLRIVNVVGVPERVEQMQAHHPQAPIVNCFGQTEACAYLSLSRPDDPLELRATTGGHPLPGMECRIVDPETGQEVPRGTLGEMCYRGPNAFDGYFRDELLTETSFDDEGFFHSGDMATMDEAGRVTFVSRLKDMLKVGGENVAAAEVEGYLIGHPAVLLAQIVAAPDAKYVEVPAAFIQLTPDGEATEQEIIDYCRGKIATFRVPRYVRFVDEWPMSGTKIKKYVLREQIAAELEQAGITEAPRIDSS